MRRLIFIIYTCVTLSVSAQHSGNFLQYLFDGLIVNPAYSGSKEALTVTGLVRNQWVNIEGAPFTISLSGHAALKNRKLAIGGLLQTERYGVFQSNLFAGVYAYRIKTGGGQLTFALQAGLNVIQNNWNKVRVTDANDPNLYAGATVSVLPKAGPGIYFQNKYFYAGLASTDLFGTSLNRYSNTVFHTGVLIKPSENFSLKPALLCNYIYGSPVLCNFSLMSYFKDVLGIGGGYTTGNSLFLLTDLRLNEQLYFGYGYERQLSRLSTFSRGTHEVMLRYLFRYKIKAVNARYF
jgi:type IX secretion system PorP/SprF family membrane protein